MNSRKAMLQAKAEKQFSAFMGVENPNEFIQPSRGYSGISGAVNQNANLKPIIINITNTDENNELYAPIFGENAEPAVPFNGVADYKGVVAAASKGLIIEVVDDTLKSLRKRTATRPFTVIGARYTFGDSAQLNLDWVIEKKEGSNLMRDNYLPSIDQELSNLISDKMETKRFQASVDDNTTIYFKIGKAINATTPRRVQIVLFVGAQTNLSDALKGKSVISVYESNR